MERKFQKVGIGVGAFHNPPKAKYSEETRNLIKLLMEESKVSMMHRKSIQDAVDKGEPLPPAKSRPRVEGKHSEPQVIFPSFWKKRSHEMIVSSGAYEREQFRRTAPLLNKEKQKRHLACMMAYGKDMPPTPHGPKILHPPRREAKPVDGVDLLEDLVQGIRERMEFLKDMESLGLGKKYRPIIQQEIAQKLRLLENLDKQKCVELKKEVGDNSNFEYQLPKPFPLGELDDRN